MKPWGLVTCQGGAYSKSIGITRLKTHPCSALWAASWLRVPKKKAWTNILQTFLIWLWATGILSFCNKQDHLKWTNFPNKYATWQTETQMTSCAHNEEYKIDATNKTRQSPEHYTEKYMQVTLLVFILNCGGLSRSLQKTLSLVCHLVVTIW